MRSYWTKIGIGAAAVFAVGYAGMMIVRSAVERGRSLFESADPITIPLAFIPFTLDGREIGTFQRVTIRRDAPRVVSDIDLRIKASEGLDSELGACAITTAGSELDLDRGFVCVSDSALVARLVPFGRVRFVVSGERDTTLTLLLDSAVVADLRNQDRGVERTVVRLRSEADVARNEARRVRDRVRAEVDSALKAAPPAPVEPPRPPPS